MPTVLSPCRVPSLAVTSVLFSVFSSVFSLSRPRSCRLPFAARALGVLLEVLLAAEHGIDADVILLLQKRRQTDLS